MLGQLPACEPAPPCVDAPRPALLRRVATLEQPPAHETAPRRIALPETARARRRAPEWRHRRLRREAGVAGDDDEPTAAPRPSPVVQRKLASLFQSGDSIETTLSSVDDAPSDAEDYRDDYSEAGSDTTGVLAEAGSERTSFCLEDRSSIDDALDLQARLLELGEDSDFDTGSLTYSCATTLTDIPSPRRRPSVCSIDECAINLSDLPSPKRRPSVSFEPEPLARLDTSKFRTQKLPPHGDGC